MLPWDQDSKRPQIVAGDSSDLTGEAVKRTMSRFINAIQASNVNDAVDAWETLCALGETDI